MTREEKKNFLLNQLPPNTDCYYVDGFINGFDCTYDAVLKDFEAQMKAKDEEIKVLECRAYHAEGYISDLHNNPKDKKFYDKKARSIVAMLFWKAKRQKKVFQKYYEEYGRNHSLTQNYRGMYEQAIMDFNKSRKMLKDNK